MISFKQRIIDFKVDLKIQSISTLQVNLTKLCNQACHHCHVDSSPIRTEMMSLENINHCLNILRENPEIHSLDITGGAPELHEHFKYFVTEARKLNKKVLVRHNLTVTLDPHPKTKASMHDIPQFFAQMQVEVVSSLPYFDAYFTDRQRGRGVFSKSIESLQILNQLGYGKKDTGLILDLVFNPNGAFFPPEQKSLEAKYKDELFKKYKIEFNNLYTITNMPIKRFAEELKRINQLDAYYEKLNEAFNPVAASSVMCRNLISIDHEGRIYDCDFNQMLNIPIDSKCESRFVKDFNYNNLLKREIVLENHCYGCTAGSGSSCGGAIA